MFPGAGSGETSVFEDDGIRTGYLQGQHAQINAKYSVSSSSLEFSVVTEGAFEGQPNKRTVTLRLINAAPPQKVLHGGVELKFNQFGGVGTWRYEGPTMELVMEGVAVDVSKPQSFSVSFAEDLSDMWQSGAFAGLRGAIAHANLAKQKLDETRITPGSTDLSAIGELINMSTVGEVMSNSMDLNDGYSEWRATAAGAQDQLKAALEEVKAMSTWVHQAVPGLPFDIPLDTGADRKRYAIALLEASVASLSPKVISSDSGSLEAVVFV